MAGCLVRCDRQGRNGRKSEPPPPGTQDCPEKGRRGMSGGQAEVLASLRLVQGRSSSQRRDFTRFTPQAVLTVGADPKCDWPVEEVDVAPIHVSLHWDGSALRVADIHGAGRVRVDGILVGNQWRRIGRRARLEFGSAAIVVEMSTSNHDSGWSPNRHNVTLAEIGPVSVVPTAGASGGGAVAAHSIKPAAAGTSLSEIEGQPTQGVHVATIARVGASHRLEGGPSGSAPAPEAPAGIVLHERAAQWGARQPAPAMRSHDGPRPGQAVVVLSPMGGQPSVPAPPPKPTMAEPRMVGWGPVALGFSGVAVGYACWLYLLYHL